MNINFYTRFFFFFFFVSYCIVTQVQNKTMATVEATVTKLKIGK